MPRYILKNDDGEEVGFVNAVGDANALSIEAVHVFDFQRVPGGTHKLYRAVDGEQIGVVTVVEHTERDITIEPCEDPKKAQLEALQRDVADLADRMSSIFLWVSTDEGYSYWNEVTCKLRAISAGPDITPTISWETDYNRKEEA